MSDEEHHFESGAPNTYLQQAGSIRKNGYIVIGQRACKVVEVSTSKTGKDGHAMCHFVAIDIFNGREVEDIVPSTHNCDVPRVSCTDYQLIDISKDGFVSLLTESGKPKDNLKLPCDGILRKKMTDGLADFKDLVVTVMSAMDEEHICALKDVGVQLVEQKPLQKPKFKLSIDLKKGNSLSSKEKLMIKLNVELKTLSCEKMNYLNEIKKLDVQITEKEAALEELVRSEEVLVKSKVLDEPERMADEEDCARRWEAQTKFDFEFNEAIEEFSHEEEEWEKVLYADLGLEALEVGVELGEQDTDDSKVEGEQDTVNSKV